jgi:hypothetical protein
MMTGSFPSDDEIRAELQGTRADIERTRADIEQIRAELADTAARLKDPMPAAGPRPIAKIAQAAKPVAVRAARDLKRAALFAAGLVWLVIVLRRRRHQR